MDIVTTIAILIGMTLLFMRFSRCGQSRMNSEEMDSGLRMADNPRA